MVKNDNYKKWNLKKAINKYLIIPGCKNPTATNYDPKATKDNGYCSQPPQPDGVIYGEYDNYSYSSWIKMDFISLLLILSAILMVY